MPHFVVSHVQRALNDAHKPLNGSRVLLLGIAYKPNLGLCVCMCVCVVFLRVCVCALLLLLLLGIADKPQPRRAELMLSIQLTKPLN